MLTRRHFIATSSAALFSAPLAAQAQSSKWATWDAQVTPADYDPATTNPWGLHPRLLPTQVSHKEGLTPGDIHVDAVARYLYHIGDDGTAMRYGVAIAKGDLYEPGTYTIRRKAKWPGWRPTDAMIAREPERYLKWADGQPPGPRNPLGARALSLRRQSRHLSADSRHAAAAIDRRPGKLGLRAHGDGAHHRPLPQCRNRCDRLSLRHRRWGHSHELTPPPASARGGRIRRLFAARADQRAAGRAQRQVGSLDRAVVAIPVTPVGRPQIGGRKVLARRGDGAHRFRQRHDGNPARGRARRLAGGKQEKRGWQGEKMWPHQ